MKSWMLLAIAYLDKSLGKIPSELNEIDWKASLSPNNDKLCRHIAAFANLPGGGFLGRTSCIETTQRGGGYYTFRIR